MTQDEISRSPLGREQLVALAREAGFQPSNLDTMFWQAMERFAALVAAHEREACAKVCDEEAASWARLNASDEEGYGAIQCAAAIRVRGMDLLTQHSQAIGEYNDYP